MWTVITVLTVDAFPGRQHEGVVHTDPMWHSSTSLTAVSGEVARIKSLPPRLRDHLDSIAIAALTGVGTGDTQTWHNEAVVHAIRPLSMEEINQI